MIYLDRGGTFTDVLYKDEQQEYTFKLLSEESYDDGVLEGIKRVHQKNPQIKRIVIGTTLITNAILERKGIPCALLITKGFRDLLQIAQQSRPKIFDLTHKKPEVLYRSVYEIEERVNYEGQIKTQLNEDDVIQHLNEIKNQGITSVAVLYLHSVQNNQNEVRTLQIAQEMGFKNIYISSEVSKSIKAVPRGQTTVLESYVNPLLQDYIINLEKEISKLSPNAEVLYMTSHGGLVKNIKASQAILSGPAGGVVGLVKSSGIHKKLGKKGAIGFDMGGTSTDVCLYDQQVEINDENIVDKIFVYNPSFDIQTVAAGGGSLLKYENGLFKVGPESSGSKPGPLCYGRNGFLSVTDANLYVGNINVEQFPAIFGPNNDQMLNLQLVQQEFEKLQDQFGIPALEIAKGFLKVADEQMCRVMRQVTTGRGKKPSDYMLFVFGGAGSQHCCSVADLLDIDTIYIHKHASIFSAYGLSKARISNTITQPFIQSLSEYNQIITKVNQIIQNINNYDELQIILKLKYQGSDYLINVEYDQNIDIVKKRFNQQQLELFGFNLERDILIDYIQITSYQGIVEDENDDFIEDVVLQKGHDIHVSQIEKQYKYQGPFLVFTGQTTIKVGEGWVLYKTKNDNIILKQAQKVKQQVKNDVILLSLFANRFMAIAEDMGRQLQNTSVSVNIKERLDFSCAIFDHKGNLIANAPHLPVHLGSMSDAVKCQINNFNQGDVIISNHPQFGGSHLPDITAITPCYKDGKVIFYVASRGHHADVGGISPGSMPSFSESIYQEGVAIESFKMIENGQFQEEKLRELLLHPKYGQGTRMIEDNVSDLKAQVAANIKGVALLNQMIDEYGVDLIQYQMEQIQLNAEESVRQKLLEIANKYTHHHEDKFEVTESDYMDGGSLIKLKLTIDKINRSCIFDFSGTSGQVIGNINTPPSVTKSAVIYCLRALVNSDIPLNQGCLNPTQIILEEQSILKPHKDCGIVGGNVLTSQRITDLILKCFKEQAASQGCMNNFTFGSEEVGSYYETIAGGSGAGKNYDGESGVQVHMTNTRITDIEVIERKYPVLMKAFKLRLGSGGQGVRNGGNGVIRSFQFLHPVTVSILSERRVFEPFGLFGGQPGSKGRNILVRNKVEYELPGKATINVEANDIITILTPGGGGYGSK